MYDQLTDWAAEDDKEYQKAIQYENLFKKKNIINMTESKEPIFPFSTTSGLNKREYFAGLALQGLLSCPNQGGTSDKFAKVSVEFADELIKELNKKQ